MAETLRPASELAKKASKPFPNDSAAYREARTALLTEEIELRRHLERVAAQRRALPPGGKIPQDYEFVAEDGKRVKLSEMFGKFDTLFVYFWMFGPERERPCPMCTSFIGSLDIPARDITQRIALAIIGRSPIDRQKEFKKERGWHNLKFYQTTDDAFPKDYRGLADNGDEWAGIHIFNKATGEIHHFWGGEMGMETADPGQDPRLAPEIAPLWSILDLTPTGRGKNWYPKLDY